MSVNIQGSEAKVEEIDLLRGVAIILMIFGHSFITGPVNIRELPWCNEMHNWIYSFHMELFFLLSGMVYKCKDYAVFMKKKCNRILVPYLFFGVIAMLLHSGGSDMVNRHSSFGNELYKYVFTGGSYWFLYALFVIYAIYPLVEKVCSKPWMECGGGLVLIVLGSLVDIPSLFRINDIVYYLPYFIIGRYLFDLVRVGKDIVGSKHLSILFGGIFVYVALDIVRRYEMVCSNHIASYLMAMAMIAVFYELVLMLMWNAKKGDVLCNHMKRLLNNCSKYSLQLYLLNGFIMVGIRVLLCRFLHVTNSIIISLGITILDIIFTLIICNYLLPKNPWAAWLCGTGEMPNKIKNNEN